MPAGAPESTAAGAATQPGRSCPLRYRYTPQAIAAAAEREAEILYVAGGLYGNLPALEAIEALAAAEPAPPTLVFNGDFNWFDVDDAGFRALNERVLAHAATQGNVEAELAAGDPAAGCGCAYPDEVPAAVVDWSNAIHARLAATAARHPALTARLAQLPPFARWRVGGLRVAVVHGDCESLAGWQFAAERLAAPAGLAALAAAAEAAAADVIASAHTCLPVMRRVAVASGWAVLANNGAAGMPNFAADLRGVITRIGRPRSPHAALYGTTLAGVAIDALPVAFDQRRWQADFLANWPPGSPAHRSYWQRIAAGPAYAIAAAAPQD